jgi:hypothetical protein
VPYPFAHPAAVLPLVRPMGRFASPSALAIGSMLPDLWYFVPLVERPDSHSIAGLFWFCLPAGVAAYLLFHLLLKQPLIALVSPRLGHFTSAGLPRAPWSSVAASILVGALTHLAWDALTHSDDHSMPGHNWPQHASTAAGTAILAWWIWRKLRQAPAAASPLSAFSRGCVLACLLGAMAVTALWSADAGLAFDVAAVKRFLRTTGIDALQGLGVALLVYCALFRRKMLP